MIALPDKKLLSFDESIAWYPEAAESCYELRRGIVVEMPKPRGKHSEVAGFLIKQLNKVIDRQQSDCFIPRECVVKLQDNTGYEPDVAVVDRSWLADEPRWESASILEAGRSLKLVIEVVSTHWRDDYALKLSDYEALGTEEYWIVDYLGNGGRRYISAPKQPTLTICTLVDGEYDLRQFRRDERAISPMFPDLELTATQVFAGNL